MGIEFKKGAVFSADNTQYRIIDNNVECFTSGGWWGSSAHTIDWLVERESFQLNTVKLGDYIEASELDTEQKYNDAVEVFELFSNKGCMSRDSFHGCDFLLVDLHGDICGCSDGHFEAKRKLTYSQLMAIGELKRLEVERDKSDDTADKGISTDEELRVAREHFSKTGTIDGNLLRKHTLVWPDDFLPKDNKIVLDGVEVDVKWDCNKILNTSETPDSSDNWPQVGDEVEFPSGKGALVVSKPDVQGIVIVESLDSELGSVYKRVSLKALRKPKTPEEELRDELVIMRNKTEECFIDTLLNNFRLIRKEGKI